VADLGYYIAGFVAVLAACLKLFVGRERERPAGAYYLDGVLACLGLSGIVLAPTTLRAAATIEPIPNLTRLVGNGLTAGAAFCMVALLAHAAYPAAQVRRRVRAQAAILFVALIAMAALLTAASTRFTVDFVNVYANHPLVAAYEVVFLSYVTWALTGTAVLVHRIAKHARRTFFRAGLRMLTAGAVLGLSWAVWKIVVTLLKVTTDEAISAESPVSSVLSAASILLIALGATLTVWGPRAAHPAQWLRGASTDASNRCGQPCTTQFPRSSSSIPAPGWNSVSTTGSSRFGTAAWRSGCTSIPRPRSGSRRTAARRVSRTRPNSRCSPKPPVSPAHWKRTGPAIATTTIPPPQQSRDSSTRTSTWRLGG
jgi:hypothetical protein